jgi:hypothetical protein
MRTSLPRKQAWPFPISNIVDHAKFHSRSHEAVIRVYDVAGDVIETHEHKGDFKSGEHRGFETKSRHATEHDGFCFGRLTGGSARNIGC